MKRKKHTRLVILLSVVLVLVVGGTAVAIGAVQKLYNVTEPASLTAEATLHEPLYQIVRKLYDMDPVPTDWYIAVDPSNVPESQLSAFQSDLTLWANSADHELLVKTWNELANMRGYLDIAPLEDGAVRQGVVFMFDEILLDGNELTVTVSKNRGSGGNFTARFENGIWTIDRSELEAIFAA